MLKSISLNYDFSQRTYNICLVTLQNVFGLANLEKCQIPDVENAGAGIAKSQSSSVSAMLSTLVPVGLMALVFITAFFLLRTRFTRVYRPRTFLGTLHPQ